MGMVVASGRRFAPVALLFGQKEIVSVIVLHRGVRVTSFASPIGVLFGGKNGGRGCLVLGQRRGR
jgi:hypothetical protein